METEGISTLRYSSPPSLVIVTPSATCACCPIPIELPKMAGTNKMDRARTVIWTVVTGGIV
ncbi:MAG: hypothetical protein M3082_14200 [Candidatus Dormibacteraeota bacterium]|nr:hypothetical protein [Candidatus Dormibacteraeota bacterium]